MKKLLTNDWTITLVATMLGVFAGIYVNEYFADRKQARHLEQALLKIEDELRQNKNYLSRTFDTLSYVYEPLIFFFDHVDQKDRLVMSKSAMRDFLRNYPNIFRPTDSIWIRDDLYHFRGDMDIQFPAVISVQLSTVAWDAFKESGLSTISNFECLYNLETVYKLQHRMTIEFDRLLEMIAKVDGPSAWRKILEQWKLNLDYQNAYLSSLTPISSTFEECH